MTFDLDLWPTDLTINRGHLLIKDYLPTKFEASGAKRSWVISCTRWSRLAWPLTLTFDLLIWLSIGIIYSLRTIYLLSLKLLGQSVLELSVAQGEVDWHDLWPTDLTINRDHLLIKDYLPTKFEDSGAKHSWVISCTRLRDTNIPTNRHVQSNMPLLFSKGGIKIYSLSLSIQYYQKFNIILKCKIIYACAFLSKDHVFTPGTGLHFEIPRRLAPGLKKTAVKIKEVPWNARIKFSFFLWNFLFSFYFLSLWYYLMQRYQTRSWNSS